ncbi:class C beta-lactamase [Pollutimonas sp. H1-120]|uniref:class C beta-lactamase n=1 Tax=Pollutimonas sp. H1-120 TaxID=3148824 RepID=UPI003B530063
MTFPPKRICLIALASIIACCLSVASRASSHHANVRGIVDAAIRPVMAEHDVPGMAVGIIVDGEPFFFNYGVASTESNTPVSQFTLFELGSLSKAFTGTLVSYAQVLGKLSLDDSPGQYIPALRGSAIARASLLNLGTYTAGGLPLQFPDDILGDDAMISYFREWRPNAAPGAQRRYSNPSIGLLGHIAGLALESKFFVAVESLLFPKLGLNHSHIHVPENAMPDYAWGYNKVNKPVRVNPGMFDAQAYGVKSTASDMIRFVQANIDPTSLEEPIRRAIEGTHAGYFKIGDMVQGLGWEQYPYPIGLERLQAGNSPAMSMEANAAQRIDPVRMASASVLFNKTGSTNGFGAYAAFVPEKKIGIVMLANRNFPIPARIKAAHEILEQLPPQAR